MWRRSHLQYNIAIIHIKEANAELQDNFFSLCQKTTIAEWGQKRTKKKKHIE